MEPEGKGKLKMDYTHTGLNGLNLTGPEDECVCSECVCKGGRGWRWIKAMLLACGRREQTFS